MKQTRRYFVVLAAFALILGAVPAMASEDSALAQGELLKVDTAAKTIAIRSTQDGELKFSYTDQTKVLGTEGAISGLATMTGSQVSIKYVMRSNDKVATEIQVHPKSQGPPPRS